MTTPRARILVGDAVDRMGDIADETVQTVVTSPPYFGLRDYGHDGQIGLERDPDDYINELVGVFREVKRILRPDGTLWLNIGDSYAGSGKGPAGNLGKTHNERHMEGKHSAIVPDGMKPKDLIGIPWMLAFALRADGWFLRQDIIWAKPNPMPESVQDRCTRSHEYLFLLTKSRNYFYDSEAIKEPSADSLTVKNKRSVWTVPTKPYRGAHFAVMPEALAEPCVLAGSREGDIVFDPFTGSGTVGVVSLRHGRDFLGTELSPDFASLALERISTSVTDGGVTVDAGEEAAERLSA